MSRAMEAEGGSERSAREVAMESGVRAVRRRWIVGMYRGVGGLATACCGAGGVGHGGRSITGRGGEDGLAGLRARTGARVYVDRQNARRGSLGDLLC